MSLITPLYKYLDKHQEIWGDVYRACEQQSWACQAWKEEAFAQQNKQIKKDG